MAAITDIKISLMKYKDILLDNGFKPGSYYIFDNKNTKVGTLTLGNDSISIGGISSDSFPNYHMLGYYRLEKLEPSRTFYYFQQHNDGSIHISSVTCSESSDTIKKLKEIHNCFPASEYEPGSLLIQFYDHIDNNFLNLLSTFIPKKKVTES